MTNKSIQTEKLFKAILGELISLNYPDITDIEAVSIANGAIKSFKELYNIK